MSAGMRQFFKDYFFIIAGTFIYSAALNLLIVPLGLYSGGIVGIAQIIRTFLTNYLHLSFPSMFDMAGLITFMLNVPLLYLAFKRLGKRFFVRTLVSSTASSFFLSVLKISSGPVISDRLTACIIGGFIEGFGTGLTLRAGGSGGGTDILGMLMVKKDPNASVGKISVIFNVFVFGICAFEFDYTVAIYSIIFNIIGSFTIDKLHYQNIKISAVVITKSGAAAQAIMTELERGVTILSGCGGYTGETVNVLVTVISKYEEQRLKKIVTELDPHSFIIFYDRTNVTGNFIKRL